MLRCTLALQLCCALQYAKLCYACYMFSIYCCIDRMCLASCLTLPTFASIFDCDQQDHAGTRCYMGTVFRTHCLSPQSGHHCPTYGGAGAQLPRLQSSLFRKGLVTFA
jgi:hypothetical protein